MTHGEIQRVYQKDTENPLPRGFTGHQRQRKVERRPSSLLLDSLLQVPFLSKACHPMTLPFESSNSLGVLVERLDTKR